MFGLLRQGNGEFYKIIVTKVIDKILYQLI